MEQAPKFGNVKPVERLFYKLKIALHERKPSNLNNVEEFCIDDWSKIPTERFRCHIEVYKNANIKEPQVSTAQVVRIFINNFDQILKQVNVDRMLIDNSAQIFIFQQYVCYFQNCLANANQTNPKSPRWHCFYSNYSNLCFRVKIDKYKYSAPDTLIWGNILNFVYFPNGLASMTITNPQRTSKRNNFLVSYMQVSAKSM